MQDYVKDGQHNYFAKRTAEGHSGHCPALALAIRAAATGRAMPPIRPGRSRSALSSYPHSVIHAWSLGER